MQLIKNAFLFVILGSFSLISWANTSPYDAARNGDLDALRKYRFEGIDLFVPDERGFTPYELTALHADPTKPETLRQHVEVMLWLKEYKPENHHYGKATIKFIQAGLNALGYDAGIPDGIMGKKTVESIQAYQADNELAETGRPGPHWLGLLYQDVLKDTQFKLTKLGFDTKGTDGLMGKNTRQAIASYREDEQLLNPDYLNLDALLVHRLSTDYNAAEKRKQAAIAVKAQKAKEKQASYVQAGLRTLGYRVGKIDGMLGSKTTNAIKKFQKKYKLNVSGDLDKKTQNTMNKMFLKETQRKLNQLGYKVGKPDGLMGNKTQKALSKYRQKSGIASSGLSATLIATIDDDFDTMTQRIAQNKAKKKAEQKARKKAQIAKQKAKKKAQQKKKAKTVVKKSTSSPSTKSQKKRPSNDIVKKSIQPSKKATNKKTVKKPKTTTRKTTAVHANESKGRMKFKRKGGRVVGCSLAGKNIPIEWCEPFYPLPKNNHCEATFKPSNGAVINLWCK